MFSSVTIVANSRNDMPAFGAIYSPEDSQDVAAYILETLTSGQSDAARAR